MTTSPTPTEAEKVVAELRAHAGFLEAGGCAEHQLTDEPALLLSAAALLESQRAELAEVRERCQMWFDTHDAHRKACDALGKANGELMKRAMDGECRALAAEARVTALEAEKAELVALLEEAQPHVSKIAGCINLNDSMGRVVTGQTEAAAALRDIFARQALSHSSTEVKNDG